jgi:hypothetical protein
MLGAAGMIGPEILGSWGAIPEATSEPSAPPLPARPAAPGRRRSRAPSCLAPRAGARASTAHPLPAAPRPALDRRPSPPAPPDIDWWRTGVIPPAGTYDNYWTDPYTLFAIEAVAMNFAELKRLQARICVFVRACWWACVCVCVCVLWGPEGEA